MRFVGPRQHNVYLVNNKAFATAMIPRPVVMVQGPDPDDPAQLAVEGVIFQQLVIPFGPNGWPPEAANSLKEHVETNVYNEEYRAYYLTNLVLNPFIQLFPPQTESDRQKWASVQWEMPTAEIDEETQWPLIQAKSHDNQFIIKLEFSEDHVLVSYCGPVTFDMQNVQPTVIQRFCSQYTFPIVHNGSTQRGEWPADEAVLLVHVQNNWDDIFNVPQQPLQNEEQIRELVQNLLVDGFRTLLVMLESSGQELLNHDLDSRRWQAQDWQHPIDVDDGQLHMQSANGIYNIHWHFIYDANGVNNTVEITCLAPCRFRPRRPQVQAAQA